MLSQKTFSLYVLSPLWNGFEDDNKQIVNDTRLCGSYTIAFLNLIAFGIEGQLYKNNGEYDIFHRFQAGLNFTVDDLCSFINILWGNSPKPAKKRQ